MSDITPEEKFNRQASRIKMSGVSGRLQDGFTKQAFNLDVLSSGSANVTKLPITYVDPMFDPVLLMFPKENLKELNRRLRHYYTFHPIVRNIINLHSTFPFSDADIRCEDKTIEAYWQYLADKLDINSMVNQMSHDYELLGECHIPGTKVLMADKTLKNVEEIKIKDVVIDGSGSKSVVKYRTSKTVHQEDLIGLSIDDKHYSWMTKEHPVMVLKANSYVWDLKKLLLNKVYTPSFISAGEIKEGDVVLYPIRAFGYGKPLKAPIAFIEDQKGIQYFVYIITSIKYLNYSGKVYSMELEGNENTYIVDRMFTVHNSFHIGNFDKNELEWSSFIQYPPENIEIHKTYVGNAVKYTIKMDEELQKLVSSSKKEDKEVLAQLDSDVLESITSKTPFQVDAERVIHYSNKPSAYLTRGESPLKAALKYLLLEDRLYMLAMTIVDRHTFPIKLWKLGSKEKLWMPPKKHFDQLKEQIAAMAGDPDYNLIYHAFLDLDIKTTSTQHEDIVKWFDWTQKRILIALAANENMFAEANPYAKDAVSIKLIMHRYMIQRATVSRLLKYKVWLPVAIKRELIRKNPSEVNTGIIDDKLNISKYKRYVLPQLLWQPNNLVNNMAEKEFLYKLRKDGELPASLIYDVLGVDTDKVRDMLDREEGTILDPNVKQAKKDSIKDDSIRIGIIEGKKIKEAVKIKEDKDKEKEDKKGPGRPPLPEGEKTEREHAMIPNEIVPPREKLTEKEELPAPKGEELPPLE